MNYVIISGREGDLLFVHPVIQRVMAANLAPRLHYSPNDGLCDLEDITQCLDIKPNDCRLIWRARCGCQLICARLQWA